MRRIHSLLLRINRSFSGPHNPVWLFPVCLILILISLFFRLQKDDPNVVHTPAVQIFVQTVSGTLQNGTVVENNDTAAKMDLSGDLEYFFDSENRFPDGHLSAGDLYQQFSRSFLPADGKTHWGVHTEVCWFRIPVTSSLDRDLTFYASNLVDHVPFTLKAGQSVYLYYRLAYDDAGIVCTPSISTAELHQRSITRRTVFASVLLGLYMGIFLFNLFLAFSTRENTYPPYLAGALFFSLYLLFREFPVSFGPWDIASATFSLPGYLCVLMFTRNFFHLSNQTNQKKALLTGYYILLVFGVICLYIGVFSASMGTIFKYIFSVLLFAYAAWIGGAHFSQSRRTAVFFLLSWGPALICLVFSLLTGLQIADFEEGSLWAFLGSNPSMYLQIAFQMISLSILLGDQINREKRKAVLAGNENRQLREQDSVQKDFILYITHELRSILTIIAGSLEGMRKGRFGTINREVDSCLETLQSNEKQLEEYISNLLVFTRIRTERESLKRVPQNIVEILHLLTSSYSSLAEARKIQFLNSIDSTRSLVVENNIHLFELMINNLLSNAFKHTSEGGEIRVGIDSDEKGGCRISIANTGETIPEHKRKVIFNKFQQLAPEMDGMGLGLHMVRQCVELLNGRVEVESGNGLTCFSVHLPLTDAPAEKASVTPALSLSQPGAPENHNGQKILLVEDNADILQLIKDNLEQEFAVSTAENGQEALGLIRDGYIPDLIISDILMPCMDGVTFFQTLRLQDHHTIPFIFLSAIDNEADKQKLFQLGAVDFLNKPLSLPTLSVKVKNLLSWKARELTRQKEDLKNAVLAVFQKQDGGVPDPEQDLEFKMKQYQLSVREIQTVRGVLRGLQDKEIAAELDLAASTVSNYLQKIYRKTGAQGRTALMVLFSGKD